MSGLLMAELVLTVMDAGLACIVAMIWRGPTSRGPTRRRRWLSLLRAVG